MDRRKIFLFFAALMVFSSVNAKTFGGDRDKTELLVRKNGFAEKTTMVTFNSNKKFDLVIDKVIVTCSGLSVKSKIADGGISNYFVTLELNTDNDKVWAGVAIYGHMNKGKKSDIKKSDIKFK